MEMVDPATSPETFVSYASADESVVEPIVLHLRASLRVEGADLFYAPADIRKGDAFIDKIGAGIQQSRQLVLFLSPSATGSFWVKQEWQAFLVQMSEDPGRRLLPVLLPGIGLGELPPLLRSSNVVNLGGYDLGNPLQREEAANDLLLALQGTTQTPGTRPIPVPFVVCAMTAAEFGELDTGSVFAAPGIAYAKEDPEKYATLKQFLAERGGVDLAACYGAGRDDWRPPIAGQTIRETVEEVVLRRNGGWEQAEQETPIRAQFASGDFFSADAAVQARTWLELQRRDGWVLVIDPVSLFHPVLARMLLTSGFGNRDSISLVVVPPLSPRKTPIFDGLKPMEDMVATALLVAVNRFEQELDLYCELGVNDIRNLRRWLYAILPESVLRASGRRPNRQQAAVLRERLEPDQGAPRGIDRAVIGRGIR